MAAPTGKKVVAAPDVRWRVRVLRPPHLQSQHVPCVLCTTYGVYHTTCVPHYMCIVCTTLKLCPVCTTYGGYHTTIMHKKNWDGPKAAGAHP